MQTYPSTRRGARRRASPWRAGLRGQRRRRRTAAAGAAAPRPTRSPSAASRSTSGPRRSSSLSPTAHRDALRDRRRRAGHRRRRQQSNYPAEAPKTDLSGFQPNAEAIAAKNPDLVVLSNDINKIVDQLDHAEDPGLPGAGRGHARRHVPADRRAGHAHRPPGRGRPTLVAADEGRHRQAGQGRAAARRQAATYYYELDPTLYSVTSQDLHRLAVRDGRPGQHRRRGRRRRREGRLPAALRGGAGQGQPRPRSSWPTPSAASSRATTVKARAGLGGHHRRAARTRSSRSTTTSPPAGARASSTCCARSPTRSPRSPA